MKKIVVLTMLALALAGGLSAQEPAPKPEWPRRSPALSVYVSWLPGITWVTNLSYDQLWHFKRAHVGFTAGLTSMGNLAAEPGSAGPHLAFILLTGSGNHHFETKLGAQVSFERYEYPPGEVHWNSFTIPVFTLGYRYQRPGPGMFFRLGVSTAGFGVGVGYAFGKKVVG